MRLTRRWSLRSLFAGLTVLLTSVAVLIGVSVLALTVLLGRTVDDLAERFDSVHLAEEAEVDLLLAARANDRVVQRQIETRLLAKLRDATALASKEELAIVDVANESVREYLVARIAGVDGAVTEVLHATAYGHLEELVQVNVAHAHAEMHRAEFWGAVVSTLSVVATLLSLLMAASALAWLRARAFRPAFELARAMRRFGEGAMDARATCTGAAELREMSSRFNEMADLLSARHRAQIAFLGGVAHDLRAPLHVLKLTMASIAPDGHGPRSETQTRALLERGERSITLIERMLGDFLDVTRIEAGELELNLARECIVDIAQRVVGMFEGRSPKHRLVLDTQRPAPAMCDAIRIEQVLTNLVSNAIKYSPDGGDVQVRVGLDVSGEDARVAMSVTDRGIGMTSADQQRLFEPFRRLGMSRETIPGVGLGLFVVRNIVIAHGGSIDVESAPGRGSTFRVCLPHADSHRAAEVAGAGREGMGAAPPRVAATA